MSEAVGTFQKYCPQCNSLVDADARFCKHCAFDLLKSASDSDLAIVTAKSERKINSKLIILIVGVATLSLGLIGAYLYKRNHAQPNVVATSPTPAPTLAMSERARQIEEKILRGETLTDKDIEGLSAYELRVLRNVHFARYGRKYDSPGLGDYFNTRSWYKASDSYNDNMITSNDKANINLIVAAESRARQSEGAVNPNSNGSSNSLSTDVGSNNNNQPEASSLGSNSSGAALTDTNVQRAVRSFMSEFTKGGNINVEGVQELPNQNAATADLRFINWVCSTTYEGGLSKKNPPPVTYDRYGMPSSTFGLRLRTYNTSGLAVLKRYNDGRWVLKEVRVGSGFNAVTITGTLEVR